MSKFSTNYLLACNQPQNLSANIQFAQEKLEKSLAHAHAKFICSFIALEEAAPWRSTMFQLLQSIGH